MQLDWSFDMVPVTMTVSMIILMAVADMRGLGGHEYWLFEGVCRFVILVVTTIAPTHNTQIYYRTKSKPKDKQKQEDNSKNSTLKNKNKDVPNNIKSQHNIDK